MYVGNATDGILHRITPDGEVEPFLELPPMIGHMVHYDGLLYVTAGTTRQVLRVDIAAREWTVLAGSGEAGSLDGVGEAASFAFPWGLAISSDGGELWVSDAGPGFDTIRRIDLGR